jgi:hypothetical protein
MFPTGAHGVDVDRKRGALAGVPEDLPEILPKLHAKLTKYLEQVTVTPEKGRRAKLSADVEVRS